MPHSQHAGANEVTISRALLADVQHFLLALADQPNAIRTTERALDCESFFAWLLAQVNAVAGQLAPSATPRSQDGGHRLPDRWLVQWRDASNRPDRNVREVAESSEEAIAIARLLLTGQFDVDRSPPGERGRRRHVARPALDWMFGATDAIDILRDVRGSIGQQTQGGRLKVSRIRSFAGGVT